MSSQSGAPPCLLPSQSHPVRSRAEPQRIPSATRGRPLSRSEYANFQKPRYWGLAAQVEEKRGYWLITKWGGMLLCGEIDMPLSVSTQDNHRVAKSEQRIRTRELRGRIAEFQSEWAEGTPKVEGERKRPVLIAEYQ